MPRQPATPEKMQHAKEVGERIRYARNRISDRAQFEPITQQELADRANLNVLSIGSYERGEVSPGSYALKQIALALRVKVQWLLYGE